MHTSEIFFIGIAIMGLGVMYAVATGIVTKIQKRGERNGLHSSKD